jgi:hypothetical protein
MKLLSEKTLSLIAIAKSNNIKVSVMRRLDRTIVTTPSLRCILIDGQAKDVIDYKNEFIQRSLAIDIEPIKSIEL